MKGCPKTNCHIESIEKKMFINTVKLSGRDIPLKVNAKIAKCKVKDIPLTYRYKCNENAIDVKIKKLLEADEKLPDVESTEGKIVDYPNFIGQL